MNALPIQLMKHHDRSQIKRSARSMLWGSVLAMILSCALFAGATHAWFSDRCSAQITLQSAKYFGVEVKVVESSGEGSTTETKVFPDDNGVYHLESGKYTVTLTWVGDKVTGGYHVIKLGNDDATAVYYSPNLTAQPEGVSFTLQIDLPEGADVTFTPVWKDAESPQSSLVNSGDTIYYPAGSGLSTMRVPAQQETNNSNSETGDEPTGNDSTETESEVENSPEGTTSEGETGAGGTTSEGETGAGGTTSEGKTGAEGTTSEGKTGAEGTTEGGTEETS